MILIRMVLFFAFYFLNFNNERLYFFSVELLNNKFLIYIVYSIIFWFSLAFLLKFYEVYRYTSALNILSRLAKQFLAYMLVVFAFIGLFRSVNIRTSTVLQYLFYSFFAIGIIKLLSYYVLKKVRSYLKGNMRSVVIIGSGTGVDELKSIFKNKIDIGFAFFKRKTVTKKY